MSSIAEKYGLFWETVWKDPNNAELKSKRKDPNVLMPGDEVFVPDKREKKESGGTEQKHRFKKKGVPAKFRVRLTIDDEPRANEPYKLLIDDRWIDGTTNGDGFLEESMPPGARKGKLIIGPPEAQDIYEFNLGSVDPIDTEEGVKERLQNLGYNVNDDFPAAVRAFQEKEGLDATGRVDDATRAKVKERFGL
jgi:hypothetical protein